MAAKKAGCLGTVLTTLFTSLLAPVLVNVVSAVVKTEESRPAPKKTPPLSAAPKPKELTRLSVLGVGITPEAALQDALRNALRQAIARLSSADAGGRDRATLLGTALREQAAIVLGYEEVAVWRAWQSGQVVCCKTVAVELDVRALREKLKDSNPDDKRGGWNRPWASAAPAPRG